MATTKNKVTTFGEQLRSLREQAELTLRQVSVETGIDTSLLAKIERNERQATKEQIKQVAIFFKVDEKNLVKESVSDLIAYKIIEKEVDIDTLKIAERKVEYLKSTAINK
jgi:transcriptional regulator with XRE-family HTH domain